MEGSLVAYKVFSNGSVLNASEINDNLMNQSVMVFSNSTARAAALPSPLEGMLTWLEDSNMDKMFLQKSISKIHLLKYKEDLKRKKLSSRTINSYLVSLRQFFSFLVSYDLYPSNPLANIKSEKIQVGHSKDDLSAKQVIDILDEMDRQKEAGEMRVPTGFLRVLFLLDEMDRQKEAGERDIVDKPEILSGGFKINLSKEKLEQIRKQFNTWN